MTEPAGYDAARSHAALFDVSDRGKVEAAGPEAAFFLQNLVTNDVKALAPGAGCEALLCNAQARVLARALVWRLAGGDVFWLDLDPGLAEKVYRHLDRHLISERVELADRTAAYAHFHLAGPQAAAVAASLGVPELGELRCASVPGAVEQVRRHAPLGLPGYDLLCRREEAAALGGRLVAAGARPAGPEAYEVLRVEAGTPLYGKDVDEGHLAPEVGRTAQAISYSKGCYLGQEPIVRVRDLGHVNRVLTGLRVSGSEPVPAGSKLWRDGKEAGHVTSGVASPRLGVIALAYVRRGSSEPGTAVEVDAGGTRRPAEVAALPFV
jgi:folate-binding protein YgfZ